MKRTMRLAIRLNAVLILFHALSVCGDVPSRAVLGQLGGPTTAVAAQGNYAVVGEGHRVAIYDISTPSAIVAVGFSDSFGDDVHGVSISGTRAYVAAGMSGLHVVDFSTPTNPSTIGAWNSPGSAEAITLVGATAYLADGPFGLHVIDISVPQSPTRVGGYIDDSLLFDAAVSGNTLFLAAAGSGLMVFDISDPRSPAPISSLDTPGWARAVSVAGSHVLVADSWEGVRVINVANRLAPVEASAVSLRSWAMDVAVSGTVAFVADGSEGLAVIDLANPAAAAQIGSLAAPGDGVGIAITGTLALLADGRAGLYVVNAATPASPQLSDTAPALADGQGLALAPGYAYVAGGGAVNIVDVSNTARPRLSATFQGSADEFANFAAIANGFVYLGVPGQLITIDVSNPSLPVETSRLNLGTTAFRDIALTNSLLLAATEHDVVIFDISTPSDPVLLSTVPSASLSVGVSVAGQYAYVARSEAGMAVLNIANPSAPTLVATYKPSPEFNAAAIEVANGYAYVGGVGFHVVNISDPANPQFVASIPVGPYRLNRAENTLLVAAGTAGVYEIDISTPAAPVITRRTILPGYATEVVSDGSTIAVSLLRNGLWLLGGTGPSSTGTVTQRAAPQRRPGRDVVPLDARSSMSHSKRPVVSSAQIVVTSTADSGAGTLRAAILAALPGDSITFNPATFPPGSPAVIRPATALPWLAGGVTLDASNAGVILNGIDLVGSESGINLGSTGNIVKGLHIINFPGIGINVGANDNTIGGNPAVGSGPLGEGNHVSGNAESGIAFTGSATRTLVIGNVVGLPVTGQTLRFQQPVGVGFARTNGNTVGGASAAQRNVIAGNDFDVSFIASTHNSVIGNFIGTNKAGTQVAPSGAMPFSVMGIHLEGGSRDNVLSDNVIASQNAIGVSDTGSSYNRIERNRIGITASGGPIDGLSAPSLGIGIDVAYNLVAQNVIGQQAAAISISGSGEIFVLGNRIGTDPSGTTAIANTNPGGSLVLTGARRAFIGGASPADANIVSGNSGVGIGVSGTAVAQNFILGNLIGRNASGSPLGNGGAGISIDTSHGNFIQRNTIANNAGDGVTLTGSSANRLRRNSITANGGQGIANSGATGSAATPLIISSTSTVVYGSACAGCLVEIFSDSADEGSLYEAEVTAGSDGAFTLSEAGFTGPYVVATASNSANATSAFSFSVLLNGTPPAVPGGLNAVANSTNLVSVQWNGVGGADRYLIARRTNGESPQSIATVSNTSFSDVAVTPDTAYVYQVRAIGPGGASGFGSPALATTTVFTDDPIVAGQTIVRRTHLVELRNTVSAVCRTAGLDQPSWTDPSILANVTPIRAAHISELRMNLIAALSALGLPLPSFSSAIDIGSVIGSSDVQELRDVVR